MSRYGHREICACGCSCPRDKSAQLESQLKEALEQNAELRRERDTAVFERDAFLEGDSECVFRGRFGMGTRSKGCQERT